MSPKEKNQVAVLSVLTLAVLGGGFMWVKSIQAGNQLTPLPPGQMAASSSAPQPAPQPQAGPAPVASAPSVKGGAPASTTAAAPSQGDLAKANPNPNENPFKKIISDTGSEPSSKTMSSTELANHTIDARRKDDLDRVTGQGKYALQGALPPVKPLSPDAQTMSDAFELKGIVTSGRGSTALVSYGGSMVYLKRGDKLSDLRVSKISRSSVTFAAKRGSYTVDVGGSLATALRG